jgi:predicted enzyme related to lactoylglutathione lyase
MARLVSVSPVSKEDINALPVQELDPAITYYKSVLGFTALSRDDSAAVLERDGARIGLVRKADHRPHEAGSLAFEVDDLDALQEELSSRGGAPGAFDLEEWGGRRYRTFFMRDDRDGYCYCFYRPALDEPNH